MVEERGLPVFRHRHQAHRPAHQLLPVAEEEEEQEEHEGEPDHRAEHAGERRSAHPHQGQEEDAAVLDQPDLDLIRGERHVGPEPSERPLRDRDPQEIAQLRDVVPLRDLLDASDEIARLGGEGHRDQGSRPQDEDEPGQRQQERGQPSPPPQRAAEHLVQRVEKEGEEKRPDDRPHEGQGHEHQGVAEQARAGEGKDLGIEAPVAAIHDGLLLSPSGMSSRGRSRATTIPRRLRVDAPSAPASSGGVVSVQRVVRSSGRGAPGASLPEGPRRTGHEEDAR